MERPFEAYRGDDSYVFICYAHEDKGVVYPEISWLHEQGVITLGKGLTIFRPAMTIHLAPGSQQFTESDFEPLKLHYQEQVLQTHIMGAYAERGLVSICDLGDRWEQQTGFPIPLGGIAVKRSLPDDIKTTVDKLISQSVQYAFSRPEASREYVKRYAQEMDDQVIDQHIGLYVNDYSINLGEKGRHAVEFMLAKAAGLGIIRQSELSWIL